MVVLMLVACGPQGFSMPDGVDAAVPGDYQGSLHFEARAKLGPVRVRHESCDVDVTVTYDPAMEPALQGVASCTLGELGTIQAYFGGDVVEMPFVAGDVDADLVTGTWEGWFLDEDSLHGEASGKVPYERGMNVVYDATFEVDLNRSSAEAW